MKFLELAQKRRSCRKYSDKPIPREIIERCVEAARFAPSACNSQPWKFIVIDTPEIKEKVANKAFSGIFKMNAFAKKAPVLVLIVRNKSKYASMLGGALRGVQFSLVDLGIVGEHFVLQAAEEGLGTCWLGWFDEKAVKKEMGIPKSKKIDAIISLGYPLEPAGPERGRRSLPDIMEYR